DGENRKYNVQKGHQQPRDGRNSHTPRCPFPTAEQRNRKHQRIRQRIKNDTGIAHQLYSLLAADAGAAEDQHEDGEHSDKQYCAYRGFVARMQPAEPLWQKLIPSRHHGKPRHGVEDQTRLRDTSDKKSQKYGGSKPSADAPSLRTETDDLRDWRYEIDIRRPAEYQDTTGACDEHESDQWRGQKDGLSNGTRGAGRSILPREYG